MSDEWARLRPHFKTIVDRFPAGELLDEMLTLGLITERHLKKFKNPYVYYDDDSKITRDLLLDVLPRMGPKTFDKFCDWVSASENLRWIDERLRPERYPPVGSVSASAGVRTEQHTQVERFVGVQPAGEGDRYTISHRPSSNVLIINNERFFPATGLNQRLGTGEDGRKLDETFQQLGCRCSHRPDLTGLQMMDEIRGYATADHTDHDFAAVCILTHGTMVGHEVSGQVQGTKSVLYGVDKGEVAIEALVQCFYGTTARSLVGKPKLFFIQSCQGNMRDYPVVTRTSDPITGRGNPVATATDKAECFQGIPTIQADGQRAPTIPETADIFVAHSAFPGYESYRHIQDGAFFVKHLVKVLQEEHRDRHLEDMMTVVKKKVADEAIPVGVADTKVEAKQMVWSWSTLTKQLFFKP